MQSVWIVVGGWDRGGADAGTVWVFSSSIKAEEFAKGILLSHDWVEIREKIIDIEV